MQSVMLPAWDAGTLECGDLVRDRAEQGTNRFGRPSHATNSYRGAYGYMQYGFRSHATAPLSSTWSAYTSVTGVSPAEGCHEGNSWFVFKDLGIPQGATITSAILRMTVHSCDNPASSDGGEWRLKFYGIAEDNAVPGRVVCPRQGYDWDWHRRFHGRGYFPAEPTYGMRVPYIARLRSGSVEYDREHTVASVPWSWIDSAKPGALNTAWPSPNLASIVQEVVARPGWSPNNRLALVLGIGNMLANLVPLNGFDLGDETPAVQYRLHWYGATPLVLPISRRPTLTVAW